MHGIFIALLDGQMLRRDGRSFACLSHAPVSATMGALFLGDILTPSLIGSAILFLIGLFLASQ